MVKFFLSSLIIIMLSVNCFGGPWDELHYNNLDSIKDNVEVIKEQIRTIDKLITQRQELLQEAKKTNEYLKRLESLLRRWEMRTNMGKTKGTSSYKNLEGNRTYIILSNEALESLTAQRLKKLRDKMCKIMSLINHDWDFEDKERVKWYNEADHYKKRILRYLNLKGHIE